jgi:hypothetical protein
MPDTDLPSSAGRLFPAVTAKLFRDASPEEIVSVLDGGLSELAMVAVAKEANGEEAPLFVFFGVGRDGASDLAWCSYERGSRSSLRRDTLVPVRPDGGRPAVPKTCRCP